MPNQCPPQCPPDAHLSNAMSQRFSNVPQWQSMGARRVGLGAGIYSNESPEPVTVVIYMPAAPLHVIVFHCFSFADTDMDRFTAPSPITSARRAYFNLILFAV